MLERSGINGSGFDTRSGMDPRVARIIERMDTVPHQDLPIAELAATVNLSASRFAYLFRRETGLPPARYLHQLRMERARLLLERTCLSVKDVMGYVGINDPSHFSRDFRRHHGVPPTGVRRSAGLPSRTAAVGSAAEFTDHPRIRPG
jgi:AraC family transcriptional regulator of arabinose operon